MKKPKKALELYAEMFKEILDLPQLQKSREVLEGESIVEIVKHALERQYIIGTIDASLGNEEEGYWSS